MTNTLATKVTLKLDKETQRTVRYAESVKDGETAKIGLLYVPKATLNVPEGQPFPTSIRVTISTSVE